MDSNFPPIPDGMNIVEDTRFSWLKHTDSYFYWLTKGFMDPDFEALLFWLKGNSAYCLYWHLSDDAPLEEKLKKARPISITRFKRILKELEKFGIMEAQSQLRGYVISNYDSACGIRLEPDSQDKWIFIRGGVSRESDCLEKISTFIYHEEPGYYQDDDED